MEMYLVSAFLPKLNSALTTTRRGAALAALLHLPLLLLLLPTTAAEEPNVLRGARVQAIVAFLPLAVRLCAQQLRGGLRRSSRCYAPPPFALY